MKKPSVKGVKKPKVEPLVLVKKKKKRRKTVAQALSR